MTGEAELSPRAGEARPREPSGPEPRAGEAEEQPAPPIRVYVASLSDYNAGRLHGAWLDARQEAPALEAAVQQMLARSPLPGAEEWAIHDYEGFGAWAPTEWTPLNTVAAVAAGIAEHGPAFGAWLRWRCADGESEDHRFEDDYLGTWPTMRAYAEELVEDVGVSIRVEPESWQPYVRFDYEALARDLEFELYTHPSPDGQVWLFKSR